MRLIIKPYPMINSYGNVASFHFRCFLETVGMICILTFFCNLHASIFVASFLVWKCFKSNLIWRVCRLSIGFAFLCISQNQLALAKVNFGYQIWILQPFRKAKRFCKNESQWDLWPYLFSKSYANWSIKQKRQRSFWVSESTPIWEWPWVVNEIFCLTSFFNL